MTRIEELIRETIKKGYVMSLATSDEGGLWVSDIMYVADDDLTLYWISETEVRHSKALEKNSHVAASITTNQPEEPSEGIQIVGVAEKVDGNLFSIEKKLFTKKRKAEPTRAGEIFDGKVGYSWYKLTPQKIRLNCHREFGYEKQDYTINPIT